MESVRQGRPMLNRNQSCCCCPSQQQRAPPPLQRISKSVPCSINLCGSVAASSSAPAQQVPKPAKPKILKKTWDKVKTMMSHHPHHCTKPTSSSSAPCTPLLHERFTFENEGEDHDEGQNLRIVRNYELLQKRLSEELHQRMSECTKGDRSLLVQVAPPASSDGLSDEFRKRLVDWEKQNWRGGGAGAVEKKQVLHHHKELAWLDKQLEKIEREKKRLEREMNKCAEREARLEKMKQALNSSAAAGIIVVRTPTATARVERITEKFAKKLYEWEEKKGVSVASSGFGLLHPKYLVVDDGEPQQRSHDEEESESGGVKPVETGVLENEEDEEVVVGPLDLINARFKDPEDDESVRRAMADVAEAMALADEMGCGSGAGAGAQGRVSSTASSCCCSEEYYDQTDSKHSNESNNSTATDTNGYKFKRRRRPSNDLSAFTSDDDEQDNVEEEEEEEQSRVVRDAESQTEAVVKVKQIVVEEDDDHAGDDENFDDERSRNVFVPTKRTIFAPVTHDDDVDDVVPISSSSSVRGAEVDKPVVVGVVPKKHSTMQCRPQQPKTQFHRRFPSSNQSATPVWCSPLVARRQFGGGGGRRGVPRKYTIGGGFMPGGGDGDTMLCRSNSFASRRTGGGGGAGELSPQRLLGSAPECSSSSSVSKSKSTGSIRSRLRVFGGWFHRKRGEEEWRQQDDSERERGGGAAGSDAAGFSLRRIGSWVYKKGE